LIGDARKWALGSLDANCLKNLHFLGAPRWERNEGEGPRIPSYLPLSFDPLVDVGSTVQFQVDHRPCTNSD